MTWVISDHVAATGSDELSVTKGQQVEVLEMSTTVPDFCLVRLGIVGSGAGVGASGSSKATAAASVPTVEGLVPMSILKPPPTFSKASPRRTLDLDQQASFAGN